MPFLGGYALFTDSLPPIFTMTNDLQNEYALFFEKVRLMREYQKEYFKTRTNASLRNAKRLEQDVDSLLSNKKPMTSHQTIMPI